MTIQRALDMLCEGFHDHLREGLKSLVAQGVLKDGITLPAIELRYDELEPEVKAAVEDWARPFLLELLKEAIEGDS